VADTSQKTEAPTPRRLKEAREKGQIAKSPDLSAWAGMLASVMLLQMSVQRGASSMRAVLQDMGLAIAHPSQPGATKFATSAAMKSLGIVAPMLIGMMLIALVAGFSQVGLKPTMKKLKPDFKRLNVFKGIKRAFGPQVWWELIKSILKIAVLIAISWPAVTHAVASFSKNQNGSLSSLALISAGTAITMFRNVAICGLAIGGIDYVVQRRRIMKQLKMSLHEVK
jgi:flagellar biosynthetic protein FlhB